jgi:epsilon-lactone hydrolase
MTDRPSPLSAELQRAHDQLAALVTAGSTLAENRATYDRWSEQFPIPDGTTITPSATDDALEVLAPGVDPAGQTVLHLHGGGFNVGGAHPHREFAARLSGAAGARVVLLDYPLAPEHPFPAAIDATVAAYRHLVDGGADPAKVVIGGDSAGGGLTIATLFTLREQGLPLPAAGVLLSPWVDLTLSGESMTDRADRDAFLSREALTGMAANYLAGHDVRDPLASPLFGDLSGLPPLLIQSGTEEVLIDDARRFADRAAAAGVDVTLTLYAGAPHIWLHFASFLPEAVAAIDEYGAHVRRHTG